MQEISSIDLDWEQPKTKALLTTGGRLSSMNSAKNNGIRPWNIDDLPIFLGGTPPIVIIQHLNGTPKLKKPFGVY